MSNNFGKCLLKITKTSLSQVLKFFPNKFRVGGHSGRDCIGKSLLCGIDFLGGSTCPHCKASKWILWRYIIGNFVLKQLSYMKSGSQFIQHTKHQNKNGNDGGSFSGGPTPPLPHSFNSKSFRPPGWNFHLGNLSKLDERNLSVWRPQWLFRGALTYKSAPE